MASAPHPSPSSLPWVVCFFLSFFLHSVRCVYGGTQRRAVRNTTTTKGRTDVHHWDEIGRSGCRMSQSFAPESPSPSFAPVHRISPSQARSVHCLLMRDEFAPSIVVDRRTPFLHTDGRRRYDDRRPACVSGLRHPSHRAAAAAAGRRGERRRGERGLARCAEAGDSGRGFCSGGCVSRCAARPAQPCLLITAPA